MEALKFKEQNTVFAENQEEYVSLPARVESSGIVTCAFEIEPEELAEVKRTGVLSVTRLTFGDPLQPMKLYIDKPSFPIEYPGFVCDQKGLNRDFDDQSEPVTVPFQLSSEELQKLEEGKTFWLCTSTYKTALQPIFLSCGG